MSSLDFLRGDRKIRDRNRSWTIIDRKGYYCKDEEDE